MKTILFNLIGAIETQLKLQGFSYECHCPSCNTLKPLAFALTQARKEIAQEDIRESAQAAQRAKESTGTVAQGEGSLAR